jgi:hypothetical protein
VFIPLIPLSPRIVGYAFEPSDISLEFLARNINNNFVKYVTTPYPLSNKLGIQLLNMTSMECGGALSTFGEKYGNDGKIMDFSFELCLEFLCLMPSINPKFHNLTI